MSATITPEKREAPAGFRQLALTVFLPFACGYFLSYLYRALPSLIADRIRAEYLLDAGFLALIGAIYFLTLALMQLPVGLALDRFGPRRVQACMSLVAAVGSVIFGLAQDPLTLMIGRALIGVGCSSALMASFKAITIWYQPARWPLANGCVLGMGGLGALVATEPAEAMLALMNWHELFIWIGALSVLLAVATWLVVPERPDHAEAHSIRDLAVGLKRIYTTRAYWRVAPLTTATIASGMTIQTQWAGLWFRDVAMMQQTSVAHYLLVLSIALTVGFVAGGVIADILPRIGISLSAIMGGSAVILIVSQIFIALALDHDGYLHWIALGLTCNMAILSYPWLCEKFPLSQTGRVNAALNVVVFAGVFATSTGLGWIIRQFPVSQSGGYAPEGYMAGLLVIIALELASLIWFILPQGSREYD